MRKVLLRSVLFRCGLLGIVPLRLLLVIHEEGVTVVLEDGTRSSIVAIDVGAVVTLVMSFQRDLSLVVDNSHDVDGGKVPALHIEEVPLGFTSKGQKPRTKTGCLSR